MTDTEAFELGRNVAVTPGKVVFKTACSNLSSTRPPRKGIQATAAGGSALINKFYIMDLQPKNSMLRWFVEQGHTVFVISWINPDERYSDIGIRHLS